MVYTYGRDSAFGTLRYGRIDTVEIAVNKRKRAIVIVFKDDAPDWAAFDMTLSLLENSYIGFTANVAVVDMAGDSLPFLTLSEEVIDL